MRMLSRCTLRNGRRSRASASAAVKVSGARRNVEPADGVVGDLAAGAGIEAERLGEFEFGDEVVVARADEIGPRVRERDLGLEHVEARHGAGLEAVRADP